MSSPTFSRNTGSGQSRHIVVVLNKQDEQLDSVLGTIKNIREQATTIGQELDEQAILLDGFSNTMASTESKMDSALKRVNEFYNLATDQGFNFTIGALIIILIILLVILIAA